MSGSASSLKSQTLSAYDTITPTHSPKASETAISRTPSWSGYTTSSASLSVTPTPSAGWDVVVLRVGGFGNTLDSFGAANVFLDRYPGSCSGKGACQNQGSDTFRGTPQIRAHSIRLYTSNISSQGGIMSRIQTLPNQLVSVAYAVTTAAERFADGPTRRMLLEEEEGEEERIDFEEEGGGGEEKESPSVEEDVEEDEQLTSASIDEVEEEERVLSEVDDLSSDDVEINVSVEEEEEDTATTSEEENEGSVTVKEDEEKDEVNAFEDEKSASQAITSRELAARAPRRLQTREPTVGLLGTIPGPAYLSNGNYLAPVGGCAMTLMIAGGGGGGGACTGCKMDGGAGTPFVFTFWSDGVIPFTVQIGLGGTGSAASSAGGGGGASAIKVSGVPIAVAGGGGGSGFGAGGNATKVVANGYNILTNGGAYLAVAVGGKAGSIFTASHGLAGTGGTATSGTAPTAGSVSGGGNGGKYNPSSCVAKVGGTGYAAGGTGCLGIGSGGGGGGGYYSGGGGGHSMTVSGAGGGGGASWIDRTVVTDVYEVPMATSWGSPLRAYGGRPGSTGGSGAIAISACLAPANYSSVATFTSKSIPNYVDRKSAVWIPPLGGCFAFMQVTGGGGGGGIGIAKGGAAASIIDIVPFNSSMRAWAFPATGGNGGARVGAGGGASAIQITMSPLVGMNISRKLVHLVAGGGGGGCNNPSSPVTSTTIGCVGANAGTLKNGDGATSTTAVTKNFCYTCGAGGGSTTGKSGGIYSCASSGGTVGKKGGPDKTYDWNGGYGGNAYGPINMATAAVGGSGWATGGWAQGTSSGSGSGGGGGWFGGGGGGNSFAGGSLPGGSGSSFLESPSNAGFETAFTSKSAIIWPNTVTAGLATAAGGDGSVQLSCTFPLCGAGDTTALYSVTIGSAFVALPLTVATGALVNAAKSCSMDILAPTGYTLEATVNYFNLDVADTSTFSILDGSSLYTSAALLTGSDTLVAPFILRTSQPSMSLRYSSTVGVRPKNGVSVTVKATLAATTFVMCPIAVATAPSIIALDMTQSRIISTGALSAQVYSCILRVHAPANYKVSLTVISSFAAAAGAQLKVYDGGTTSAPLLVSATSTASTATSTSSVALFVLSNCCAGGSGAGITFVVAAVLAAPPSFGSSSLVLLRVGDGGVTSPGANPLYLDEITGSCSSLDCATFVRARPLPRVGSAPSRACTLDGSGNLLGGFISLTSDAASIFVPCYDAVAGTLTTSLKGLSTTAANVVNRVLASVGANGIVDTSMAFNFPDRGALTSGFSDGSYNWMSGNVSSGIGGVSLFYTSVMTSSGARVSTAETFQSIGIFEGIMYGLTTSRLGWVGDSLGTLPITTAAIGFTKLTTTGLWNANTFVFQTRATVYVCDGMRGIVRFISCSAPTANSCVFDVVASINGGGCKGLTARTEGSQYALYVLSTEVSGNKLFRVVGAQVTTSAIRIYSASVNTRFTSIALAPTSITCRSCTDSNPGTGYKFCSLNSAAANMNSCISQSASCAGSTATTISGCQTIAASPVFSKCTSCLGSPLTIGFAFCSALSSMYPNQCTGAASQCSLGTAYTNYTDCDAAAATIATCSDCILYRPYNGFYWCNTPVTGEPRCMSTESSLMCGENVIEAGNCVGTQTGSPSATSSSSITLTATPSSSSLRSASARLSDSSSPSTLATVSWASNTPSASWATISAVPSVTIASLSSSSSPAASSSTSSTVSSTDTSLSTPTFTILSSVSGTDSPSVSVSSSAKASDSNSGSGSLRESTSRTVVPTPSKFSSYTGASTPTLSASFTQTKKSTNSLRVSASTVSTKTKTVSPFRTASGRIGTRSPVKGSFTTSATRSNSPSTAKSRTASTSRTGSISRSVGKSVSASTRSTPTFTVKPSKSSTRTSSRTSRSSPSRTANKTISATSSQKRTMSASGKASNSIVPSRTPRASLSSKVSISPSVIETPTRTDRFGSPSNSASSRVSVTRSATTSVSRSPLKSNTQTVSRSNKVTVSSRASLTVTTKKTITATSSPKATTRTKSAIATRKAGSISPTPTPTATRVPPYKIPIIFSMPGTTAIGKYAIAADSSTRTSSYLERASGACSYDGSLFYITTFDSPILYASVFATTAKEFAIVNYLGTDAWGVNGRPGACHVAGGLLYVAVRNDVENSTSIYAPTPALPTLLVPAVSWTRLLFIDAIALNWTNKLRSFALSSSQMTVYVALNGAGIARCWRSGSSSLEEYGGCVLNTKVLDAVDMTLGLSNLNLYIVTPRKLLIMNLGYLDDPSLFVNANVLVINTAANDGREYRGVGLQNLVIPTATSAPSSTNSWSSAVTESPMASSEATASSYPSFSASSSESSSESPAMSPSTSSSSSESQSEEGTYSNSPSESMSTTQIDSATRSVLESFTSSAFISDTMTITMTMSVTTSASYSSYPSFSPSSSNAMTGSPSASNSPSPSNTVTKSPAASVSTFASDSDSPSVSASLSPSLSSSSTVDTSGSPSASVSPSTTEYNSDTVSSTGINSDSTSPSASGSTSPSTIVSKTISPSQIVTKSESMSVTMSMTGYQTAPPKGSWSLTSASTQSEAPKASSVSSRSGLSVVSVSQAPSTSPNSVLTRSVNSSYTSSPASTSTPTSNSTLSMKSTGTAVTSNTAVPSSSATTLSSISVTVISTLSASTSGSPSASSTPWHVMTAGNMVALQIGSGSDVGGRGVMVAVYLTEFTAALPGSPGTAMVPVQSFLIPGVTLPDNSPAYGALSLSYDKSSVVFAAFGAAVGAPSGSSLTGLRAIVSVNKWGYAKTRYVSGPAVSTIYAATTCDNAKFYISTSRGIYSSSYSGQSPIYEGPSTTLEAYSIMCDGPNATTLRVYAGRSNDAGYLAWTPSKASGVLGTNALLASSSVSALRGFSIVGYNAAVGYKELIWVADYTTGVSYHWYASGVGGTWQQSLANSPNGQSVIGVLYRAPNVFVSTANGIYVLNPTTASCTTSTTVACTWLNKLAAVTPMPVLVPSGYGTATTASFAGIANVPSSADTLVVPRPFTAGNFLAVRVGDGTTLLGTALSSNVVFLEEYTPLGKLVQMVKLTSNLIPSTTPFSLSGTGVMGSMEGLPSRSPNGYFVSLSAYGLSTTTGVVARIINSGGIDYSTRFYKNTMTMVYNSAVSNNGDSVWVCDTYTGLGTRLASAYVGFAGGSAADTATYNPSGGGAVCTTPMFACSTCGSTNTLYIGNASMISSATVSAPTTLATTVFLPISGLTFTALRQFILQSDAQLWAADYGIGIYPATRSGSTWSKGTLRIPCAVWTTFCTTTDLLVVGVAIVPGPDETTRLYVTTTTRLYALDVTTPSAPIFINNFTPIMAARTKMEFRGLVLAPIPPPGGSIVYPGATTFSSGNILALRAESGSSGSVTSRLFVDEINPVTKTVSQSWLLPSSGAGKRATLPGGTATLGQLTATADGEYVLIPVFDVDAGTSMAMSGGVTTESYGHTVAKLSCRGSVSFTTSVTLADMWYGASAAAYDDAIYVASTSGLLSISPSGTVSQITSAVCAAGFGSVNVLGPYSSPTTYALSRGCGMYIAAGTPTSGFALDTVTTSFSATDALTSFMPVTTSGSTSTGAEYFYVGNSLIRNALVSGGAAGSRGFVSPSSTEAPVGVYSSAGLASGIVVATTAAVYTCSSLACGLGTSAFNLTSATMFRTTAGKSYANSMDCTINVVLASNFRVGFSFESFILAANDVLSVIDTAGRTLLPATSGSANPTAINAIVNSASIKFSTDASGVSSGVIGQITATPFTCGTSRMFEMAATALVLPLASDSTFRMQPIGLKSAIKKRCDFLVTVPPGSSVTLTIAQFNVGVGSYFTVYEGANPYGHILGRLLTSAAGVKLQTRGLNNMYVTYISSDTFEGNGIIGLFNASIYTPPAFTNVLLDAATGPFIFSTADGDKYLSRAALFGNYLVSSAYVAQFTAPNGYIVNLTFTEFSTELNYDLCWVLDGATMSSPIVTNGFNQKTKANSCPQGISGTGTAGSQYVGSWCASTGSSIIVRLLSDVSIVSGGIGVSSNFQYKPTSLSDPMMCVTTVPSTIGGSAGGWVAGVTHYLMTGADAGMSCTVTLVAPTGYAVALTIISWSVRTSDYFSVTDGPNVIANNKYPNIIAATSLQPTGIIYSSGNSMTINYVAGLVPQEGILMSAIPVLMTNVFPSALVCTRLISSASTTLPTVGSSVRLYTSPSHSYGNNVGCGFIISAASGLVVNLAFTSFVIESGADFFVIFDGPSSQSPLLANLSGSVLPVNVTTTGTEMFIMFTTDAVNTYAGVNALAIAALPTVYTCATGVSTTRTITAVSRIQTQAAATFAAGVSCSFKIVAPTGYAVYLEYVSFALTGGLWSVYDGSTAAVPVLTLEATGNTAPSPTSSSGNTLYVSFTSTSGGSAGAIATIKFVSASTCTKIASAGSGSAYLGLSAAPTGCGWNERRMSEEEESHAKSIAEPPKRTGELPVTAPCHVDTPRDNCLVPTREIKVVNK